MRLASVDGTEETARPVSDPAHTEHTHTRKNGASWLHLQTTDVWLHIVHDTLPSHAFIMLTNTVLMLTAPIPWPP